MPHKNITENKPKKRQYNKQNKYYKNRPDKQTKKFQDYQDFYHRPDYLDFSVYYYFDVRF